MDLNKLRYSKTVAVKDMEAHSNKTEKAAVSEKDNSLSVGKMSLDYLKGEATIETKIVFIISGGDKREKDYFKMLMKDRHIRRLKIAFVSKKGQGLVPSQMFELAKEWRCVVMHDAPLFIHHYTNRLIFFKLRSFEDFFDLCVSSI